MNLDAQHRKVSITDTTLRDAHQSLLATRMRTQDMLPIAEKMEAAGFHSLEVWGGATYDSAMRFLNEDPWDRLRLIRKAFKKAKLQMLLRGQNLVGYKHYADDVVEMFCNKAVENGIDIMRIFDALNDVRNMEKAIEYSKKAGAHIQATVCYTISPIHDVDHYVRVARDLKQLGADSICVKDMAGILTPKDAYLITKRLKEEIGLPVQLHCHYTSGMASMSYLEAIYAGADVVDCSISSMSMSTSQPPAESLVAALKDTPYDTGLDLELLSEIAEYWKEVRTKYGQFDVADATPDANVLLYQVPGGMISNFISQLAQQDQLHRLKEVFAEVPRVKADLGHPPLVTPSSQIVGTQAMFNVLMGRYKMVTNEVKAYMRGLYGTPPGPVNEEIRKLIIGDEQPITDRPADHIEPGLPEAREQVAPYYEREEDILLYALFPQVAVKFLKERTASRTGVDQDMLDSAKKDHPAGYYPV